MQKKQTCTSTIRRWSGASLLFILISCSNPATSTSETVVFFDIQGYFEGEAKRLTTENLPISKRVVANGHSEHKTINIKDWNEELQLFIASDINKPAWKDSYVVEKSENSISYLAKEASYKTQSIHIKLDSNSNPTSIKIKNQNKNMLYSSEESLNYSPNHEFEIIKTQQIRWMDAKSYHIKGQFIPK